MGAAFLRVMSAGLLLTTNFEYRQDLGNDIIAQCPDSGVEAGQDLTLVCFSNCNILERMLGPIDARCPEGLCWCG